MSSARQVRARILLALGFLMPAAAAPSAQVILRTFEDLWPTPERAAPMDSLHDMDGDGLRDIILSDSMVSEVRFVSSATGEILRVLTDADVAAFGIGCAGVDDVTGDGVGDFLLSGRFGRLFSGATFEEVWTGQIFDSRTTIGDIDGDGLPELVLGGYGLNERNGSVQVLYGGSYDSAYSLPNPTLDSFRYGHEVASLGDVDGDGLGDFAASAPGERGAGGDVCVPGEVYVHSGVDGHVLYRLEGEGINSFFGSALASPGDVTGDGVRDLVVGEPTCCQPDTFLDCKQTIGRGRISFYDGRKGTLLGRVLPDGFGAYDRLALGSYLLSIGDLDGDGWGDVLTDVVVVLAGTLPSGALRGTVTLLALDGRTRSPIYRLWNPEWETCGSFASAIASAGDLNDDDFPDWFQSTTCVRDQIHVVSGAPIGVSSLGEPCGGLPGAPRLRIGATGVPYLGKEYAIHLTGAEEGTRAQLLLGDRKRPARRPSPGRCAPMVEAVETREALVKDVRPGVGVATAVISIPNDLALIGTVFHAQWQIQDAAGVRTSRVLAIEIQPGNPLRGW